MSDFFNETSNTAAGINTPENQQDCTATDMISEAVEETMENIEEAFTGHGQSESAERHR